MYARVHQALAFNHVETKAKNRKLILMILHPVIKKLY